MLISHRHQFIYIKTRKTAGTSIEGLLEPLCAPDGHTPMHIQGFLSTSEGIIAGRAGGEAPDDPLSAHSSANDIVDYVGEDVFASYLKIYAVRDPYDKVVSWFWHVMPVDTKVELQNSEFDAVRKLFRNWLLMRPQLPQDRQFYRTAKGPFRAHRLRYENLRDDLQDLAGKLNTQIDLESLPRWKTDTRGHKDKAIAHYYDDETRDVVQQKFELDFRRFGYQP